MEENKKISVTIQGNKYVIKGNNSEEYINRIARQVDHIMNELGRTNSLMNKNMVAVLCSLNLADQLYIAQEEIVKLEDKLIDAERMPDLIKELEKAQHDAQFHLEKYKEAQRSLTDSNLELEKYHEMIESYKNKIKQNKIEIDAARQTIADLQNQIFDNQIEIVKMKKELDEYKSKDTVEKKHYLNNRGNKKTM
jgi:cell division protein ZapA